MGDDGFWWLLANMQRYNLVDIGLRELGKAACWARPGLIETTRRLGKRRK